MSLDTTIGGATSNSYCTAAEADAYHATRLFNPEWASASTPTKESALQWATRLLDRQDWDGTKVVLTQALRWPRIGVFDMDNLQIDSRIIPQWLKNAEAELAWYLVKSDRTIETGTEGFSKIQAGSVSVDVNPYDRPDDIPPEVQRQINPYLTGGGGCSVTMERG